MLCDDLEGWGPGDVREAQEGGVIWLPWWPSGRESACNVGVRSLVWEDPLQDSMATHSSILAWRIPWTEEPAGYSPWGHKESDTTE